MCTEFAKGIAIGMIAGGAVGAVIAMPKHKMTMTGRMLKAAGHLVDSLSETFGM